MDAEQDYALNRRAKLERVAIHAWLDELSGLQWEALLTPQAEQITLPRRIEEISGEIHRVTGNR